MFFRGRQPEASIWRRFRVAGDGFTFAHEDDHYTAHIVANAERVVDLFYNLTDQLPPAVDVVMDDFRSGRSWGGEAVPLPDVRDSVARLKNLLEGKGLEEQTSVQPKSWKTKRLQFPAAPDLVNAVSAAAERLALQPA